MGIDVSTTALWAELATWKPSALEIITRAEYWGIRGASRMGRALTAADRHDSTEPVDPSSLTAGHQAGRMVVSVLGKTEPSIVGWKESPPPAVASVAEAGVALAAARGPARSVTADGLDVLLAVAHAMQSGAVSGDATDEALRVLAADPPRTHQRSQGPMASLLAASASTLWIPAPLTHAWDGPFGSVASLEGLRDDLAALPWRLRALTSDASEEVQAAQNVVASLVAALADAGDRCVRMAG